MRQEELIQRMLYLYLTLSKKGFTQDVLTIVDTSDPSEVKWSCQIEFVDDGENLSGTLKFNKGNPTRNQARKLLQCAIDELEKLVPLFSGSDTLH